jgi:phosphoribosylformylglycinamidine cyclo-ligase
VAALLEGEVELTYLSHITGHGLLKLMRSPKPLCYRIERLPDVPGVLSFLAGQAGLDARAAYSTLNMGSGFAVYCAAGDGEAVVETAHGLGYTALQAGRVEHGARQVRLEPLGVRFDGSQLELSTASS